MYRGIIQHRTYITGYLEQKIVERGLEQPIGLGRIWRVVHTSTTRGERPRLVDGARRRELVPVLAHPNGWWRITAQRLLVERRATRGGAGAARDAAHERGRPRAAARALDARRARRSGRRDRRARARRPLAARARRGDPHRRAVARAAGTPDARARARADERSRARRATPARGVARRASGGRTRRGAARRARRERRRSDRRRHGRHRRRRPRARVPRVGARRVVDLGGEAQRRRAVALGRDRGVARRGERRTNAHAARSPVTPALAATRPASIQRVPRAVALRVPGW